MRPFTLLSLITTAHAVSPIWYKDYDEVLVEFPGNDPVNGKYGPINELTTKLQPNGYKFDFLSGGSSTYWMIVDRNDKIIKRMNCRAAQSDGPFSWSIGLAKCACPWHGAASDRPQPVVWGMKGGVVDRSFSTCANPTTPFPDTSAPVTPAPLTTVPTPAPRTQPPVTPAPATSAPATPAPLTAAPAPAPRTQPPLTPAPATPAPAPETSAPTTAPATIAPLTSAPNPSTQAPVPPENSTITVTIQSPTITTTRTATPTLTLSFVLHDGDSSGLAWYWVLLIILASVCCVAIIFLIFCNRKRSPRFNATDEIQFVPAMDEMLQEGPEDHQTL